MTFLAFLVVLGYPTTSNASEDVVSEDSSDINEIIANDDTKKRTVDENGIETIEITDPETLEAIESNLDNPKTEDELKSFVVKKDTNIQEKADSSVISPRFVSSIQRTGTRYGCGTTRIGYTSGTGLIKLSVSRGISTEISAGTSVGLNKINAELGTSIKQTETVTSSTEFNAGSSGGEIYAYSSLQFLDFDVYRFGLQSGSGTVTYADGVCFSKY